MQNKFKNIVLTAIGVFTITVLAGCKGSNSNIIYNDHYTNTADRPTDIPVLDTNNYIAYPEKPSSAPIVDASKAPSVNNAYNANNGKYEVNNQDGINISYTDITNWSYVYLPIENYSEEYCNMKLTATGNGAERIAIQAVYYEMYDLNYSAVTVYQGDVVDGEQYFVFSFNKQLLDQSYNAIAESSLAKKNIIGLCLFIDSNPTQIATTDTKGSLNITKTEFLKDGDPALKDIYVSPSVGIGYLDSGYDATKDSETNKITISRAANTSYWTMARLTVANYTSSYSAINFKYTSTGVKKIKVAIEFNTEGNSWTSIVDLYTEEISDGLHEKSLDFSDLQPISSVAPFDYVAGYYVKNYKITNLCFYLDTSDQGVVPTNDANIVIDELSFERTEDDGAISVSKSWNSGTTDITLGNDIIAGGTGTVSFNWYSSWYYLTMPIKNYQTSRKLVVSFQAPDGISHMGIAVVAQGKEFVIRGSVPTLAGANTQVEEKTGEIEGLTEKVEYDEANKIYTITFDFKYICGLLAYDNKKLNELALTSLRFYLNDPNSTDVFEGSRTVRFISIEFK